MELMDFVDVQTLREALFECHIAGTDDRIGDSSPCDDFEAHELQELTASLASEAIGRCLSTPDLTMSGVLSGLGSETSIDLVTTIEDWETRYQAEEGLEPDQ